MDSLREAHKLAREIEISKILEPGLIKEIKSGLGEDHAEKQLLSPSFFLLQVVYHSLK